MTPQELKKSILQLAIHGKLVEQRPEEGTADELYQQIQAEKQRLINKGTIKKEKPLPEIAEDEKPFSIPDGWMWVRFSNLCSVLNGDRGKNYPAKETLSPYGIPFISALNLDGCTVVEDDNLLCLSDAQYERLGNGKLQQGDVVVCIRGSLGKHGRYPFTKGAIASSLVICRLFLQSEITTQFLMTYLDTPLFFSEIEKYNNGTAQPNLAAKNLEQFFFPLPPLSEQKRIVAKIEELLPYIDRYEKAWSKLENLNKRFPMDLQKSIIQTAIQGKLVEQRPEEGTADELYQQIQAEKQRLIKEGTIKKEKPLPEITEDEKPFDIPESWKWVRVGQVMSVFGGKRIPAGRHLVDKNTGHKYIRVTDMKAGSISNAQIKYVPDDIYDKIKAYTISKNDVYITVAGTIGQLGLVPEEFDNANLTENADKLCVYGNCKEFVYYIMSSSLVQKQIHEAVTKVGQPKLAITRIQTLILSLPPLAEQKRIVAKLEEILPLCEKLKSN